MANRKIKIGYDKRPAPVVPRNVPLYNQVTGQILTDEGGTPLVSFEDTVLSSEATSKKSTSVVFTEDKPFNVPKNIRLTGTNFSAVDDFVTVGAGDGDFQSELSPGDKFLLPTGLDGSTKVYEVRTIKAVVDNNTAQLSQNVTSNVPLFGELVKLNSQRVNPVLKTEEQFSTFSEVSTSLLGYPKAEEQLGLFSNVSTYGLDDDEFLFYRRDGNVDDLGTWATRKNEKYGRHFRSRSTEEKEESAISIESFRVPYSYPYGPRYETRYSSGLYSQFDIFMKIGALLHDTYIDDFGLSKKLIPYTPNHVTIDPASVVVGANADIDVNGFVIRTFLPGETIVRTDTSEVVGTVITYKEEQKVLHFNENIGFPFTDNDDNVIPIEGQTSGTTANINGDMTFQVVDLFFSNLLSPLNPYYESEQQLFDQVDNWTEIWRDIDILDPNTRDPDGVPLTPTFVNTRPLIQQYIVNKISEPDPFGNSVPGYSSSNNVSRAYLESRKAFRYQPGRISGYTFGVRASNDAKADKNVFTEWGIGNDTDDLVFQINGSDFSIVRRSVVPLSDEVLIANNLKPEDQILVTKDTQNNENFTGLENKQVYETKITRDRWNGDPLNGNGPSRWGWIAENVTMYKIEFGWYGAIGVQFYAYVPIENGEARWVKLHRLVIENKLGEPCMGDPYYKFKYSLIINDYVNVRTPQYIYKYGTSCYIDGGDQGTVRVGSASSDLKVAPTVVGDVQTSTSLVALSPKTVIYNEQGFAIKNKQSVFPDKLSVKSDGLTELSLVKCKACPGFGHTYQPSLTSGYNGDTRQVENPLLVGGYDRSVFQLPEQTKTIVSGGTTGSIIIEVDDVSFLRVGDIISDLSNAGVAPNTSIIGIAGNVIQVSQSFTSDVTGTLTIQPVFLESDYYSKIIGSRIYNRYIGEFTENAPDLGDGIARYSECKIWSFVNMPGDINTDPQDYLDEVPLPESYRSGNDILPYPFSFDVRLSQYKHLAVSPIATVGIKNQLLFLYDLINDNGIYSNGQRADFRIGVTNLRPVDDAGTLKFFNKDNVETELTDSNKVYLERVSYGISRDADGYEIGESGFGRTEPFLVDYRIARPPGTQTGRCAYVNVEVPQPIFITTTQFYGTVLSSQVSGADPLQDQIPGIDLNAWYIRSTTPPVNFDPDGAEIGFNPLDPNGIDAPLLGSGIKFDSELLQYQSDETGQLQTYYIIKLTDILYAPNGGDIIDDSDQTITIWFNPVTMTSFRYATGKQQAFEFSPFPLYFFVEFRDGCRLNSLVIKEENQSTTTYNPRWITNDDMTVDVTNQEIGPLDDTNILGSGNLTDSPPNFVDPDRLSSALVDVQNQSNVRPYEVIDKIYVGDEVSTIDLSTIFSPEKETITPDLLNTTAYFVLATSKESGSTTNVAASLTYLEQQ